MEIQEFIELTRPLVIVLIAVGCTLAGYVYGKGWMKPKESIKV